MRVVAKGKIRTATLEELQTIVDHMPERLRLAVLIAAWCGLRQGETMELRRQDVNLTRGTLAVSRAVTRVAGADPIVGDPKSEAGNRVVFIPPHILPAVKEHLQKHTGVERDALLFWGRDSGEQLAPSTLYRWFYPAREAAGLKDLRCMTCVTPPRPWPRRPVLRFATSCIGTVTRPLRQVSDTSTTS